MYQAPYYTRDTVMNKINKLPALWSLHSSGGIQIIKCQVVKSAMKKDRRDCRAVREVLLSETWIPLGQSNVGAGKSSWFREGGGRESMREE